MYCDWVDWRLAVVYMPWWSVQVIMCSFNVIMIMVIVLSMSAWYPHPRLWRVPGAGGVEPAAGHRIQVSKVTFRLVIRIVTLSVK